MGGMGAGHINRHLGNAAADDGLCEAAMANQSAQAFMSVLKHPDMWGGQEVDKPGCKLSFTPVSLDEYAASFKFWPEVTNRC